MQKTFSIKEAISFGWNTFKSNWKFWIILVLIAGMGRLGSGMNYKFNNNDNTDFRSEYNYEMSDETMSTQKITMLSRVEDTIEPSVLGAFVSGVDKSDFEGWVIILVIWGAISGIFLMVFFVLSALASIIVSMGYINVTLDAARGNEVFYKTLLNHVSMKKALRFASALFLSGLIILVGFILFVIPGIYFALKYAFVPFVIVDEDPGIRAALKRSAEITKGIKLRLLGLGLAFFFLYILGFLAFFVGIFIVSIVASLTYAYVYVKVSSVEKEVNEAELPVQPQLAA